MYILPTLINGGRVKCGGHWYFDYVDDKAGSDVISLIVAP